MSFWNDYQTMPDKQFSDYRAQIAAKDYSDEIKHRAPVVSRKYRRKLIGVVIPSGCDLIAPEKPIEQLITQAMRERDVKPVGAIKIEIETWRCAWCEMECAGEKYQFDKFLSFCSTDCTNHYKK